MTQLKLRDVASATWVDVGQQWWLWEAAFNMEAPPDVRPVLDKEGAFHLEAEKAAG